MNNKININPSSTKWLEKDDRVVADYFCDLGFRSLKQILDMRVFDLMNMQGLNAVRVEEVIICLYKWLNPNTAIDEAIYNGMMSQPFLYTPWRKEHKDLAAIKVGDLVLTPGINMKAMKNYIYMYELFVKPTFGKKKLVQVKKSDVRRFYNQLIDDKVLKPSTVDVIHNIVHQVFQIAVDDDMIRSNPAANMLREIKMAHGSEIEKRKALTLEQEELFLGYLARTPKYQHWYPVFYIMANTGMRVGEITGLRWCDVDMENGIISVNHTLVYYNHRDEKGCYFSINTPKTKAGIREIPMTEGVKQAFLMEKEFQEECGMKSVSHIEGYSDFVFVNRNGEVQHQGTLNKALQRIMRDCNSEVLEKKGVDSDPVLLPKFSCHVLRHTFATRMCESGLNVKVVQSVLGHADVTTTLDIYVTVTNDLKKREITAFETYLKTGAKQMANV